jgi:serine phosphatase RsbU (regulator of sigma subunit)
MVTAAARTLGALRSLLQASHLAGPDDLPMMVSMAGGHLGADRAVLYLVDYDQVALVPLNAERDGDARESRTPIAGTLAGRVFIEVSQRDGAAKCGSTLWTPVVDGTDRLGVLRLDYSEPALVDDDELRAGCVDVAAMLAELVVTRSLYGDAIERARRTRGMTIPAEMQWRLLPPLTFVSPHVSVAGTLAPAERVAGDSFDYAMNGDTLHLAILDAMGHGLRAALLSAIAIAALRNSRREEQSLAATAQTIDAAISSEFSTGHFVTAVIGHLDVRTGWWRWLTFGHPPALLVRGGRVVKVLDTVVAPPLGLGLLSGRLAVGQERLQPGDRLLLHTDGVTEARSAAGEFFGSERLVDFTCRQAADGRPVAETLRRLNLDILDHQDGVLQDDATTLLVEWPTNQSRNAYP